MLDLVQEWVLRAGAWGALGFFIGAFLEEIALPIPSPLLLIGVAFFVGKPLLSLSVLVRIAFTIVVPISAGATLGSFVIYSVAYGGGKSAITRFGPRFKITWEDVEALQKKLSSHKSDRWILFLSRCIPFSPTTLLTVLAGIVRMNPWVFLGLTFFGVSLRVGALFALALLFSQTIFH